MTSMSATFPAWIDPCVFERPSEWAALRVEATRASSRLILWFTQARCITGGYWDEMRRGFLAFIFHAFYYLGGEREWVNICRRGRRRERRKWD